MIKAVGLALGALALADLASCLPTGVTVEVVARQVGARPATHGVTVERDVAVPARDGIRLSADVYHPTGPGPFPTVMVRLPLSPTRQHQAFSDLLGHFWAGRGYHVVVANLRGRGRSGGTYEPLVHEREDGLDTLAWLAAQPWHDGRLAMWGGSVFGYTQWVLADQVSAGPDALFIQIASSDNFGMFYPGGAFSLQSALYWAMTDRGAFDAFPTAAELAPGLAGWPVIEADDRLERPSRVFDAWAGRRTRDAYWRAVDGDDRPERLAAPALLLAGWYDPYLPTQLDDYVRIKRAAAPDVASRTRLIVGPWTHAREVTLPGAFHPGDYRFASLGPSLPFYDALLAPPGARPGAQPPVRLFVMGENRWRDEQEWPLARARETAFYLRSGGRANTAAGDGVLSRVAPADREPEDFFVYDPSRPVPSRGGAMLGLPGTNGISRQNDVEARRDVLVYSTPPLEAPLEVTGPVRLELFVETSAPATDFTAKLVDVHPDGSAYNLSEGIVRRAYPRRGEPSAITIDLWPTSNLFKAGHRIRLEVSSSSYPRFDRHPNTLEAVERSTRPVVAYQAVHHDARTPSRLILPLVPR